MNQDSFNHNARFDCLSIANHLCEYMGYVANRETCVFAYLSCILLLYKELPISDWGYNFISTDYGIPYSADIEIELNRLIEEGLLVDDSNRIRITSSGVMEYNELREFSIYQWREPFIKGACSSILSIPPGLLHEALGKEPELKSLKKHYSSKVLLDENGNGTYDILYNQFSALSKVIGYQETNFMIPSVIWLNYLLQTEQRDGN